MIYVYLQYGESSVRISWWFIERIIAILPRIRQSHFPISFDTSSGVLKKQHDSNWKDCGSFCSWRIWMWYICLGFRAILPIYISTILQDTQTSIRTFTQIYQKLLRITRNPGFILLPKYHSKVSSWYFGMILWKMTLSLATEKRFGASPDAPNPFSKLQIRL